MVVLIKLFPLNAILNKYYGVVFVPIFAKIIFMRKTISLIFLCLTLSIFSQKALAWGKTGHNLVAEIAFQLLDEPTKKIVQEYLGKMSIEEASTWMDESKGNSYYNYMRSWHYLDIDKGLNYTPSSERNILTVLHSAILDLRKYQTLDKKEVKRDLLLIFHLIGDLHQPLHTGYSIDKGGNTIEISSPVLSGNLHSVWDTQILEYKNVQLDTCMNLYKTMEASAVADFRKINELKWMYQSRSYLDKVYGFENNFLDKNYIDNNITIIKKQLVVAGIRLAAILDESFNPNRIK